MVIGAPSLVPEAAAAGQLMSPQKRTIRNLFGGGQVIEIIVKDRKPEQIQKFQKPNQLST